MSDAAVRTRHGRQRLVLEIAGLAIAYVATAKLGLSLSVAHGNATAVWAPAGISLAAVLVLGYRVLPGVFVGALLANATTPIPLWVAGGIAAGNTLEAFVGAYLLRRLDFHNSLDRVRDVLAFSAAGAAFSTTFSATVGVSLLSLAREIPSGGYDYHWNVWWLGDLTGDLLVAPLLLAWWASGKSGIDRRRSREAVWLVVALIAVAPVAFFHEHTFSTFAIFPLLVWASLRFGQKGASAAVFIASAFGVWAILGDFRPLGGANPTEGVQLFQGLMSLLAVSCLVIAATIAERERVQEKLRLEAQDLHRSRAALSEAQRVAALGSWEWDVAADEVSWSDELYRLYGLQPQSVDINYEAFLRRVHPDERALVAEKIRAAIADHRGFTLDHRVVLPDGGVRWLHGRGDVVTDDSGTVTKMVGTAQDITERKEAEARLTDSEARLAEAQRVAQLGSWAWDIEGDKVSWSRETYAIYGLDTSENMTFEKALSRMSEKNRADVHQSVANAFRVGIDHDLPSREFDIVHPDGSRRVVSRTARIVFDNGRPVRMFGTVQDVTQRKQAEENARKLERAQARQRQALEINDEVVQGLSIAKYALDTGDHVVARRAVSSTLDSARSIVSDLLAEPDAVGDLGPGALVRETPARLDVRDGESS